MANLPEKNITTVSAITSIPSNTNIFVNANGQFVQASINDVVKASNVVNDETLSAMKEFIDSQFQTLTGSPILAQDTTDGYMPSFKGKGASLQNSYSGYQLFDIETFLTNRGATYTKSGNTYTITLTQDLYGEAYQFSEEDIDVTLKVKEITNISSVAFRITLLNSNNEVVLNYYDNNEGTALSGKASKLRFDWSSTIGTFSLTEPQLELGGTVANDYEPYVGAQPSPNPSYPQPIKSKGDMGWFDGELLQGLYYSMNGNYAYGNYFICNKNTIPCNPNDEIKLMYGEIASDMYLLFYDENKSFINSVYGSQIAEFTATAPTNAKYFNFDIKNANGITPSTAKKIVVTINGTYVVKVKSVGKNLATDITNKENTTVTDGVVKQTAADTQNYIQFKFQRYMDDKYVSQIGEAMDASELKRYSKIITKTSDYNQLVFGVNGKNIDTLVCIDVNHLKNNTDYVLSFEVTNLTQGSISWKNIQIEIGSTATEYKPYEEHTEWIPLSEPLRENDTIECVDGVYGVVRGSGYGRITSVTKNNTDTNDYLYYRLFNDKKHITTVKCNTLIDKHLNTLIGGNSVDKVGITGRGDNNVIYINVGYYLSRDGYENNVEAMNTWLAENPTYVEYKLAEPVFEPFADQSPFYRLKTFEGVTHISATDDMEMVVEVPTSRAGGVASIGWSKGNLAQIETQNLSAKIAELQTAMVNM